MGEYNNKTAVITGAASGIGRSIAKELASRGANVVMADRHGDKVKAAAEAFSALGGNTMGVACDVTDRAQIEALADTAFSTFDGIDMVFANAGVGGSIAPFVEQSIEVAEWTFSVNFFGAYQTTQYFARRLIEQGRQARLVITGSEHSLSMVAPGMSPYAASKHAVLGMADMLRHELPEFINVHLLCPGAVRTGITSSAVDRPEKYGGPAEDPFGGEMPFGMDPDEVAKRTLSGIERGDFYLVTHRSVLNFVEERYREVKAAFEAQTKAEEDIAELDTRKMFAAMPQSKKGE